jgi:hypothetical protein
MTGVESRYFLRINGHPQQPAAVVAVEMWESAFGAGFQAQWDGQQIFGQASAIGPTERHFHSEPGILPILVQMSS